MESGVGYTTLGMYLLLLNCTLEMVKMVNFMLCTFYHNKKKIFFNQNKKKPGTKENILYDSIKEKFRDLPGGPVSRTLSSQCRGPGFDPWSGNWITRATTKKSACCN